MPRKKVVCFFVFMIICSSIIISFANTWHLIYGKNAIPKTISEVFYGIEIQDGKLIPHRGSPYIPPPYLIASILKQIFKAPSIVNNVVDSFLVIDTTHHSNVSKKKPVILMMSDKVVFYWSEKNAIELPYTHILPGIQSFHFTQDEILQYFNRNIISILISYFFLALIHDSSMYFFSIFFLTIAAFIFKIDRNRTFGEYLKIAVHAISPVIIGGILIAIAGVTIQWVWHILIFLSTVVMFRAISAIRSKNPTQETE